MEILYAHETSIESLCRRIAFGLRALCNSITEPIEPSVGNRYALISTIVLLLIFRLLGVLFPNLYHRLDSWRGTRIPSLRIQQFELMPADRIANYAIGVARLLRLAVVLAVLYFYISLVLGFFPWTQGYAQALFGYVLAPLKLVGSAAISYLPNIFFIAVISLVSFYVIKAVRIIFSEIGKETITLPDFYLGWAEPT